MLTRTKMAIFFSAFNVVGLGADLRIATRHQTSLAILTPGSASSLQLFPTRDNRAVPDADHLQTEKWASTRWGRNTAYASGVVRDGLPVAAGAIALAAADASPQNSASCVVDDPPHDARGFLRAMVTTKTICLNLLGRMALQTGGRDRQPPVVHDPVSELSIRPKRP